MLDLRHNHLLKALNFRIISNKGLMQKSYFFSFADLTSSQAYKEFAKNLQNDCQNNLDFYREKANISKCLITFRGRNGSGMSGRLDQKVFKVPK